MTHSQGLVNAKAIFVKPADFGDAWEKTDLWNSATDIPGVNVTTDDQGVEARLFGSETSGQVALYSAEGQLLFSGGITGARGHSGDNDGRTAIVCPILATGKTSKTETPVFGCALVKGLRTKTRRSFVMRSTASRHRSANQSLSLAKQQLREHQQMIYERTDRMFVKLMVLAVDRGHQPRLMDLTKIMGGRRSQTHPMCGRRCFGEPFPSFQYGGLVTAWALQLVT